MVTDKNIKHIHKHPVQGGYSVAYQRGGKKLYAYAATEEEGERILAGFKAQLAAIADGRATRTGHRKHGLPKNVIRSVKEGKYHARIMYKGTVLQSPPLDSVEAAEAERDVMKASCLW
jgi:adenine-specific DNA methylase